MSLFIIICGGVILLSFIYAESPEENFLEWEGQRILHPFIDATDYSSDQFIIELQDENGMPVWFGRHIYKDVCISGKCKMIRLWLFWDAIGNYLGYQLHDDEPLTKSDHTIFEEHDYQKLNDILSTPSSVLGNLKQSDLVIIPDSIENPYELDGYTAATQPVLSEVVVKDAVYTCYTLWHTIYGPIQEEIFSLLEEGIDSGFLTQMLEKNDPEKIIWVIETVKKHTEYNEEFYPQFIEYIKSEDDLLSGKALNYFRDDLLDDELIQKKLIDEMPFFNGKTNVELIWMLIENGGVPEGIFQQLIEYVAEGTLNVGSLNLVYKLFRVEFMKNNKEIEATLNKFLNGEDAYVRILTQKVLEIK